LKCYFRALGGILDFYIFTGPTPNAVVEQYTDVIGKPFIPPYWALGYQQCKFGYKSLERTKQILEQTQKAGIPIDVQWNDIDYMNENKDFTVDSTLYKGLGQFVEDLHKVRVFKNLITNVVSCSS
jgi:lysosomal alpha-glucosidase